MLAPALKKPFIASSAPELPDNVTVHHFSAEHYRWTTTAGDEAQGVAIAELLVRMAHADGTPVNNQKYFVRQHQAGNEIEIDRKIVPAAIDFATKNDLIGGDKVIALNIFQASVSREMFEDVVDHLAEHELGAGHILFELLEHPTPITSSHVAAVAYGNRLGFNFGIDDVDPRNPHDQERVRQFAPYCVILKIKREVMRDIRNGLYSPEQFEEDLGHMIGNNELLVVAEGVPRAHQPQMPPRVNATQSMFGDLAP